MNLRLRKFLLRRPGASEALAARLADIAPMILAVAALLAGGPASAAAIGAGVPASVSPSVTAEDAQARHLRTLLEAYWADYLSFNPALALSVGDYSTQESFDDSLEEGWRTRMVAMLRRYSNALTQFDAQRLSEEDRTSYDMLRYRLDRDLAFYGGRSFELARMMPLDHFQGLHTAFALDAAGSGAYPFKTLADYEKALIRAGHYARWSDDVIVRLREGVQSGVVLPRMVVERILPQLHNSFGQAPETSEFWGPIRAMPREIGDADRARLTEAFRVSITTVIQPAYQRLYDYLNTEYLPHTRQTVGLGELPDGAALYSYYVDYHTSTDMTPRQIHELGVAEVERISAQLAAVRNSVHFKGTLREFLERVRTDPQLHFDRPEEVVPAYEAARKRILGKLPELFDVMPKAPYEIRALPESARQSQGNGYFAPAAADGSRPGILWMNIYASGVMDRFNVMTISLHEGLPGHHMQTSVGQEQLDMPSFRRFDATNAYVEGWGLYAESLGTEMGFFADPWQYYGHLNYAILRANRLVVDTGLHAMGWSVEQGVAWMMDHSSMTREQAAAEVERYVAIPGQALSYKIGELRIRALRERAQRRLGRSFDVKAFHDQILLGGSMPLKILEQRCERWLQAASAPRQTTSHSNPGVANE